jgi:hypothetical protein
LSTTGLLAKQWVIPVQKHQPRACTASVTRAVTLEHGNLQPEFFVHPVLLHACQNLGRVKHVLRTIKL